MVCLRERVHIIPLAKLSTGVCINTGEEKKMYSFGGDHVIQVLTSCIIEMLEEEEKNLKFIVRRDVTKTFSLLHLVTILRSFGSLTKTERC